MSLNRYAKRKDKTQEAIVKALRKAGVKVWILDTPVDLLTFWGGLFQPMEVKPENWNGKYSSEEQREACEDYGVPVVKNPEEALRAIGII